MTQITYDAARDTSGLGSGAHTVTVGTGALALAGQAAISLDNTATKAELLEALAALEQVISRDFSAHTRPGTILTGNGLLTEGGDLIADENGIPLSQDWDSELPVAGALASGDLLVFVEDGVTVKIDVGTPFVTAAMLADDCADSDDYAADAFTTAKIALDQITAAKIADDAVETDNMTDGSIDTAFFAADAVEAGKFATDALDSEHYAADSIDTEHLANGSISHAKLGTTAVTPGTFTTSIDTDVNGRIVTGVA